MTAGRRGAARRDTAPPVLTLRDLNRATLARQLLLERLLAVARPILAERPRPFDELRPEMAAFRDERGRELFDLPDAPLPAAARRELEAEGEALLAFAEPEARGRAVRIGGDEPG